VEFYGEGVQHVSAADRQAIAGMCPDYGARCAYFPIDSYTLDCVRHMGKCVCMFEYSEELLYKGT
jgi:aconitate hydratase